MLKRLVPVVLLAVCLPAAAGEKRQKTDKAPQYQFRKVRIPVASADEKRRETVSVQAARQYVEQGARAWSGARKCVSCHTNGSYLLIRPSLTKQLGPTSKEIRDFFVAQLNKLQKTEAKVLRDGDDASASGEQQE